MGRKVWVDPPNGWKYGFPKIFDHEKDGKFYQWLVAEGYPQAEIDALKDNFWCRQWEAEDDPPEFKKGINIKPNKDTPTEG